VTVPEFRPRWNEFLSEWENEQTPWYLGMGELADHVVDAYERGMTAGFKDFFSAVESVLQHADTELQNLIWVGLFEDMQNIASHRKFGFGVFRTWLGPQSLVAWDEVDRGMKKVAAWTAQQGRQQSAIEPEAALQKVENPKLRKIIERMYRKQ
jgi:hypothetical protein